MKTNFKKIKGNFYNSIFYEAILQEEELRGDHFVYHFEISVDTGNNTSDGNTSFVFATVINEEISNFGTYLRNEILEACREIGWNV